MMHLSIDGLFITEMHHLIHYLKKQMQQTLCDLPMYCLYRCLVLNPKAPEIDTYAFCLSVAMVYSEEIDMNSEELI